MLTVYIVSAIVAGALILLSAVGGGHDAGHDVDVGGHDFDASHDADVHSDGAVEGTWIPFFSLRFWTYFFAAFGIIGLLLTVLNAATAPLTIGLALGGGLVTGFAVAAIMRWLKGSASTDSASLHDLLGKEAKVLVGVRPSQLGKVRIEAKGEIIDLLATSESGEQIEIGEQVVVVGVDGNQAKIARRRDILGD